MIADRPPLVVAYGMGVDSTAMLVGMHQRGVRPDLVLFADTGGEKPETYAYLPIIQSWLERVGFPPVVVVRNVPKRFKHASYTTLEENCLVNATLPSLAFGRKSCSLKWKRAPQDKFCRHHPPFADLWRTHLPRKKDLRAQKRGVHLAARPEGVKITKAIGYDAGVKDGRRAWKLTDDEHYHYVYFLREWGWSREECCRQILAAGLPLPPKSACFYCPATQPEELLELHDRHPHLTARIVTMEARAQPNLKKIDGLWRKGTKKRPGSMTAFLAQHGKLPVVRDLPRLYCCG